jgi:hypothetical protein
MQEIFTGNEPMANSLASTISKERINRYLSETENKVIDALALYHWNTELCQAMYLPLQIWEISLRNKLNSFIRRLYGDDWPYQQNTIVRQLKSHDKKKLSDARLRQQKRRKTNKASTGSIVADLSAGFWVSLLSEGYEVPFRWNNSIGRVFSYDATMDRETAHTLCSRILEVRNRVAHHEPIYQMPLTDRCKEAERVIKAICPGSHLYMARKCELPVALAKNPKL